MLELTTATIGTIGLLVAFDVGYYIKTAVYTIGPRLLPKVHPLKISKMYGICTTRDIDFMLNHVNNARYVRQMDFGRLNHLLRSRLLSLKYSGINGGTGRLLLAATNIRYRKSINIFMPYRLETQVVHWDDQSLYYRQNFVSLHDGFVRAAAYTKLATVGTTPAELLETSVSEKLEPLQPPEDLVHWIECMRLNSENLRASR